MQEILIGSPEQIRRYAQNIPEGSDWKWAYFGIDIKSKECLEGALTSERRHFYGRQLNSMAADLKPVFIEWVAGINSVYGHDPKWWAQRFASKSPFQGDFFLLFCCFHLLKEWLKEMPCASKKLLVAVEDPLFQRFLKEQLAPCNGVSLRVLDSRQGVCAANIKFFFKIRSAFLLFLFRMSASSLVNFYLRTRYHSKMRTGQSESTQILIYTEAEDASFEERKFEDIYRMDRIASLYREKGYMATLAFQFGIKPRLRKKILEGIDERCFLPDLALSASQWLEVLFTVPMRVDSKACSTIGAADFSRLLLREHLQERSSTSFWSRLCLYQTYKTYFERTLNLKLFIYLFENQAWEKMVLMAARDSQARIVIAGYQHASILSLELNYFLGRAEQKISPQPDYIISNGAHNAGLLQKSGFKNSRILNGGSVRFSDCGPVNQLLKQRLDRKRKNILFLLQSQIARSMEVIASMDKVVSEKFDFELFVKPHPAFFNRRLARMIKTKCPAARIAHLPLNELLPDMDLVVYSSTTAALEAGSRGLALYKIDSELIDADIIEELGLSAYRMDESGRIDLDKVDFCAAPHVLQDNTINEPVNASTWLSLLEAEV